MFTRSQDGKVPPGPRRQHPARPGVSALPPASRETTTELLRVLCYPRFGLTPREREDLLALAASFPIPVLTPTAALATPPPK